MVVASTPKAALLGMLASRLVGTRRRVYLVRGLRLEGLHGLAATVGGLVEPVTSWCATDLLFVSKSLQTAFLARHPSNPTKANVLGGGSSNGVNLRRFHPPSSAERQTARSSFGLADDDLVVGFVGRLTADKGIADLVTAMSGIVIDRPRVKLLLIGGRDEDDPLPRHIEVGLTQPWIRRVGSLRDTSTAYWAMDICRSA